MVAMFRMELRVDLGRDQHLHPFLRSDDARTMNGDLSSRLKSHTSYKYAAIIQEVRIISAKTSQGPDMGP